MARRCSTPNPCTFEKHCKHRQVPLHMCNGHFWPNNTGEACQQYELAEVEIDMHDRISAMMGAHQ